MFDQGSLRTLLGKLPTYIFDDKSSFSSRISAVKMNVLPDYFIYLGTYL